MKLIDKITPAELAELAQEQEITDPIDWGMLAIDEEDAYLMMALSTLEIMQKQNDEQQAIVAAVSLTKLMVENFVLNLKLQSMINNVPRH